MNFNEIKMFICVLIGIIGNYIASIFGGWTGDMTTLLIFMATDFIMGLCVAGIFKKSNKSKKGAIDSLAAWRGLCRKGVAWLIILVAHRLDIALGSNYLKTSCIIAFIANEGISIIENAGLMGIKFPEPIVKAIDVLSKKGDDENDKHCKTSDEKQKL